jgi:hypothetical protein
MTRADIIKALDWHPSVCQGPQSLLVRIEGVVAQAEARERGRCAQIADAHASCEGIAQAIAAEIRNQA